MSVETVQVSQLREANPGYEAVGYGGARLRVETRALDASADPEALVQAVRKGWRSALDAKVSPGRLKTLITRFVRASALDVPGAISIDDALKERFDVALDSTCGVCRGRRVWERAAWWRWYRRGLDEDIERLCAAAALASAAGEA